MTELTSVSQRDIVKEKIDTVLEWINIGLGVAAVVLTALTIYLSYRDMVTKYKTEFTPIPRYMIDEQDLIGYNKKGEKIVLKNQSAYYKAVECNRKKGDDKYGEIGIYADLNGDVGKQWLALYTAKNEIAEPILADSLKVAVDTTEIPAGYSTGVHMFGSDNAFNLNAPNYVWNNEAKSVYIYFKHEVPSSSGKTASGFTTGSLGIAGGAGFIFGAVVTAVALNRKKKKPVTA